MALSIWVPIGYIGALVLSLSLFSSVYRKRSAKNLAKGSEEPWFPDGHPERDVYQSLVSAAASGSDIPENILKAALLCRAMTDVKRIVQMRDDKQALSVLLQKGSIGDETTARFALAEKELEAEILDVVSEANTFREGWGQIIFPTASEMVTHMKHKDVYYSIPDERKRQVETLTKMGKSVPKPTITLPPLFTPPGTSVTVQAPQQQQQQQQQQGQLPPGAQVPPQLQQKLAQLQAAAQAQAQVQQQKAGGPQQVMGPPRPPATTGSGKSTPTKANGSNKTATVEESNEVQGANNSTRWQQRDPLVLEWVEGEHAAAHEGQQPRGTEQGLASSQSSQRTRQHDSGEGQCHDHSHSHQHRHGGPVTVGLSFVDLAKEGNQRQEGEVVEDKGKDEEGQDQEHEHDEGEDASQETEQAGQAGGLTRAQRRQKQKKKSQKAGKANKHQQK